MDIKPTQITNTPVAESKTIKPGMVSDLGGEKQRSDSVIITEELSKTTSLQEMLAQLPEVDEARVAQLREQIESGSFETDSLLIADRLIEQELDLL
jgi:negative regulator of flagellin synthesis FlgM